MALLWMCMRNDAPLVVLLCCGIHEETKNLPLTSMKWTGRTSREPQLSPSWRSLTIICSLVCQQNTFLWLFSANPWSCHRRLSRISLAYDTVRHPTSVFQFYFMNLTFRLFKVCSPDCSSPSEVSVGVSLYFMPACWKWSLPLQHLFYNCCHVAILVVLE